MLLNRKVFGRDPEFPATALLETPAGWEWWYKQVTPGPLLPRAGRGQLCSSFLCSTTELSWVTQDHDLWFCTIKLRLVGSKSWNGGTAAPLEQTRQRNAPMKGLAKSLANVAAPAELVISSSLQTGVHHVSHQHSRTSQDVCPSFLFLQCPKPNDKCWVVRLSSTPEELLAVQLFCQGVARTSSQQCLLRKLGMFLLLWHSFLCETQTAHSVELQCIRSYWEAAFWQPDWC